MKKSKTISSLYFGKAEYRLGDIYGNSLLLKIDYANGNFSLHTKKSTKNGLNQFQKEVNLFAQDLIKRKSKKNLAPVNVTIDTN